MNKIKTFLISIAILSLSSNSYAKEKRQSFKDIIAKDPDSSYLFLFAERSSKYLDWSKPSSLAVTTLSSQINKRLKKDASSIGHAQIAWYCNDKKGIISQGATGQTGQNGNEGFQIVNAGWGLSVLDTVFLDGYLETEAEVIERLEIADRHNNLAWVAIKTKPENCFALSKFVEAYNKSGAAKNYGFPVEPLKLEGAGCTSFANASFKSSNLALSIADGWVRSVKIPLKYMGKMSTEIPGTRALEVAKNKEEEKYIPLTDFMFKDIQWAKDDEPHKDFYYYDPELFYESLVHIENKYRESANIPTKNPIRTKNYDETQLKTKKTSEDWYRSIVKNNSFIKIDKIHGTTGLIIELK
ncbi:MAG: hypothetical protein U0457_09930 [Candidatus Sericytochromatia bacterium]